MGKKVEYTNVAIPKQLADYIDKILDKHPELGYKSRAEFVKDAIRQKLKEFL